MVPFEAFVAVDWSGAKGPSQRGIAVAFAESGDAAPTLVAPSGGWSRTRIVDWLMKHAEHETRALIGMDLSPAFPFADSGGYFPGLDSGPEDAKSLWAFVEEMCANEPHLGANSFFDREELARHFRLQRGKGVTYTGDAFEPGAGRLRRVERRWKDNPNGGQPSSCFNLVGAAQVGKSSLTGMRVLHRVNAAIPVWPYDPIPEKGPLIVEIYTTVAARAAQVARGKSKVRNQPDLDEALRHLGSRPAAPLKRYDDHPTDAIVSAAWLRAVAGDAELWAPEGMTADVARTEGWTFGIR